ncbi:MAG: hypothetical protein MZV70_48775 [Desulfobacterales bacterium]|nr:hypothetical protein [Desulfobacterales bacterium]
MGMFDERYHFFFEETDWAYQMRRAGWKVLHVPTAFIYHLQGRASAERLLRIAFYRSRYQFFRKWRSRSYYLAVRARDPAAAGSGLVSDLRWNVLTLGLLRELRDKWVVYGRSARGMSGDALNADMATSPADIALLFPVRRRFPGPIVTECIHGY